MGGASLLGDERQTLGHDISRFHKVLSHLLNFILLPSGLGRTGGGDGRGNDGERSRCLGGLGVAGRGFRALDFSGVPGGR